MRFDDPQLRTLRFAAAQDLNLEDLVRREGLENAVRAVHSECGLGRAATA